MCMANNTCTESMISTLTTLTLSVPEISFFLPDRHGKHYSCVHSSPGSPVSSLTDFQDNLVKCCAETWIIYGAMLRHMSLSYIILIITYQGDNKLLIKLWVPCIKNICCENSLSGSNFNCLYN